MPTSRSPGRSQRAAAAVGYGALGYAAARPLVDLVVGAELHVLDTEVSVGQIWGAGLIVILVAFLVASHLAEPVSASAVARACAVPLLFLVAYAVFTLGRPGASFAALVGSRFASWLLLIAAAARIARTARGQGAVFTAGYAAAVLSASAIAVSIALDRYGSGYYDKDYDFAVGQYPFGFASFAALALAFVLAALLAGRLRRLSAVLAVVSSVWIALSYVRAAYVAAALVLGAYVWAAVSRRRAQALRLAGLAGLAALAAVVVFRETAFERFTEGEYRLGRWRPILEAAFDDAGRVLSGGGAELSSRAYEAATGNEQWAHNDFLELLATGGLPLLAAYLALLAWLALPLVRLVRDRRQSDPARDAGVVLVGAFAAFVWLSFISGVAFTLVAVVLALQIGLVRGMRRTPGATLFDAPDESEPALALFERRSAAAGDRLDRDSRPEHDERGPRGEREDDHGSEQEHALEREIQRPRHDRGQDDGRERAQRNER